MIWAERVWTLALPFQLGPSKLCLVAAKKLIEFDIEYNVIKWEALNSKLHVGYGLILGKTVLSRSIKLVMFMLVLSHLFYAMT